MSGVYGIERRVKFVAEVTHVRFMPQVRLDSFALSPSSPCIFVCEARPQRGRAGNSGCRLRLRRYGRGGLAAAAIVQRRIPPQ